MFSETFSWVELRGKRAKLTTVRWCYLLINDYVHETSFPMKSSNFVRSSMKANALMFGCGSSQEITELGSQWTESGADCAHFVIASSQKTFIEVRANHVKPYSFSMKEWRWG